jgi:hypothetical protein
MLPWGTGVVVVVVALAAVYGLSLVGVYSMFRRPRHLRWGATDEEVTSEMLGDDIVAKPSYDATRAVTVHARPEHIYPWIVQMGLGRAGWYSYDWLDNLGRPSAWGLVPHLQQPEVGDLIPMSPNGKHGIWVKEFEPNRRMLWGDKRGYTTWLWEIRPIDENRSRLITRVRLKYRWLSPMAIFNPIVAVFDWPMMRKSMLGIKRRAEAMAPSRQ